MVSNVADAPGLAIARGRRHCRRPSISHRGYPDRETFDRAVSAELERHGVELVALAGFMRIFSPWFPAHWQDRIINIHPSLLPAFKGLHVQQQAIDAGVRLSGCTVHFVTPDLDAGPIIAQAAVPVLAGRHRGDAVGAHPAPGAPALSAGRALVRRGPHLASPTAASTVTGVPPGATLLFSRRPLVRYKNRCDFNEETDMADAQDDYPAHAQTYHVASTSWCCSRSSSSCCCSPAWRWAWSATSRFFALVLGIGGTVALLVAFAVLG